MAAGQKLAAAPELESALQDLATFLKAAPLDVDALVYQAQALCLLADFGGRLAKKTLTWFGSGPRQF